MEIHKDVSIGNFQNVDDIETPTIEERFEDSYYRNEKQYQPRVRERNYNSQNYNTMW